MGTSHQLLQHYLAGLEEWKFKELYRRSKQEIDGIQARAHAENRGLTPWEEERVQMCDRGMVQGMVGPALLRGLAEIREAAKRGPLHREELRLVKLCAKNGLPGAEHLLQKCLQVGLKGRKSLAEIVRATPRHESEPFEGWVRRIWAECDKYETNIPRVITEELLEKYSRRDDKKYGENLPLNDEQTAKSFRSVEGESGNSAKVLGRRADAQL